MSRFLKPLQEFVASKADFRIVYSTASSSSSSDTPEFVNNSTQRICVLDSSFNPPHLAHYAIIEESLKSNYDGIPIKNKVLLLLLSVQNADKVHPQPEPFDQRLELISLMADHIAANIPITVAIGLTKQAMFVNKSLSILNYLDAQQQQTVQPGFKLTFLIGFDTLIRILNPKYYLPDKLSVSLEHFMKMTDLVCLTRHSETVTINQQSVYVKEISLGQHEEIPSHWSKNIFILRNMNDEVATFSSSGIRKEIESGNPEWKKQVLPEVAEYIEEHNLYKEKEALEKT
ncbi:hypothetical protein KGF57_005073 [Candida theae]|uniref:Nicotinamide-nucleotide adenylyltransferase n=1 Tax=Candida theae TaxID=1198502 RepID=A0AAD5FW97_9ASCO|nr:uncharacterized protein KGF57_005073 [Candida theae]KAI5948880.1 hypothetical protein KGF57_005073 [Candida theae]